MTLFPTALEAAAKAMHSSQPWSSFWSINDARLLATAAITAYLAQAEKEGWVMVPREPTWQMQVAGRDAILAEDDDLDLSTDDARAAYRAMLAAAQNGGDLPAPPMARSSAS